MRVPFSWLKDFVEIPDSAPVVLEKLREIGVPIEKIEILRPGISGIVSGKILSLEAHPNADKLRIAQVDLGKQKRRIITGAGNVALGDRIPVAVSGSRLAGGKVIQETTLRGLSSQGMMCSAAELDLDLGDSLPSEQRAGVLILDPKTPVGLDLSSYLSLNESVFLVEPFANRPDFLSVFGIAREAAALYRKPLRMPPLFPESAKTSKKSSGTGRKTAGKIQVIVENGRDCPRYVARLLIQAKARSSPLWMAVRLQAAGIRPINSLVDITNYVLLELGQPLHAFDFQKISDQTIRVRRANPGEKLLGIDGEEYELSGEALVIASRKRPVALAGILGGRETEISHSTQEILLESAVFNPSLIRRASAKLGIRTESSRRFEKGLDPVGADWGSRRACFLFQNEGTVVSEEVVDVKEKLPKPCKISIHIPYFQSTLGLEKLESSSVRKILKGLGFSQDGQQTSTFSPPPFRSDIQEEIDLVEEVARHFGYNRIPSRLPKGETLPAPVDPAELFEEKLRDLLRGYGLTETISYSLGSQDFLRKFSQKPLVRIQNPLTRDFDVLRPFLYPGLLLGIQRNFRMKTTDLAFFEIGKVFERNQKIDEKQHAAVAMTGKLPWGKETDFFAVKGIVERLRKSLNIPELFSLQPFSNPNFHPYRCAAIQAENQTLGFLGELHPSLLQALDIEGRVYVFEMQVDALRQRSGKITVQPIPQYPESRRDISLLLNLAVPAGEVLSQIRKSGGSLVEEITLFDVYQGPQVPEGKKSLAFSILYRSPHKTLTDEEVNRLHEKIREDLQAAFQAIPRV